MDELDGDGRRKVRRKPGYKIIFIGPRVNGQTSFLNRYARRSKAMNTPPTIGGKIAIFD